MTNLKTILLLFTFTIIHYALFAQVFPIQVNTQLIPPNTPYLSDYTAPGTQRLMVQLRSNDVNLSDYSVKLRLTIEGVGITIQTKQTFIPQPITLQGGGIPMILYGEDISEYFNPNNLDFAGYTKREFETTGKIPEGVYRFSVEVLDYNRNTVVSNKGTTVAWMILNDPPLLNLPRNDTKVRILDPTNIAFTWTPRHTGSPNSAFSTEYIFRLVEIWPINRNPYDAFLSQPVLYEITTTQSQILYGIAEPALIPGRKYAWQVQARDKDGRDLFKNQGSSEVYVFQYGDELGIPENFRKETANASTLSVRWEPSATGEMPLQYRLRYKPVGGSTWYETITDQRWSTLSQLKSSTEYDVQVRAEKEKQVSEYTTVQRLSTTGADPDKGYTCGQTDSIPLPDSGTPLFSLAPGDIFTCYDFKVVVTKVDSANSGMYMGKGMTQVNMFNGASVEVSFSGNINSEYKLTTGTVQSLYERGSSMGQVVDQMHKIGEEKQPEPAQESETDSTTLAPDVTYLVTGIIDSVYVNADGEIVVIDQDGNETSYQQPLDSLSGEKETVIITDSEGNAYTVSPDGQVSNTTAAGSSTTAQADPIKDRIIVLILEQFEEEIEAWLRINGKGGEEDEDIFLAEELPSCFPKDADVLKPIKENTIPYFKEHPVELLEEIEKNDEKKQLFDQLKGKFKSADEVNIGELSEDSQNAVCEALMEVQPSQTDPITAKILAKVKQIHEASGKQVIALVYCKDCTNSTTAFEKEANGGEVIVMKSDSKVCLGLLFKVDGENVEVIQGNLVVNEQTRNVGALSFVLPTLGSSDSESLGIYNAEGTYASCTNYLDTNFFSGFDYCSQEPTESLYDQLLSAVGQCINSSLAIGSDDNDIVHNDIIQAVDRTLSNPIDQEKIKVIFSSADGKKKELGDNTPNLTVSYKKKKKESDANEDTWEISAKFSEDYVKRLSASQHLTKYGDFTKILNDLTNAVDELMLKAQVKFCAPEQISPNCVTEQLRLLQVLSINIESTAQTGTIHEAMWHSTDGKRNLLPSKAKWIPAAGGVVDEVVEEATSISMLVKTLWEVYDEEEKQQAIRQLFTGNGMEQAVLSSLNSLVTSDADQLQYKASRVIVMLAFFYFAIAENAAKSLDDALQQATELASKVEYAPSVRQYLVQVSQLGTQGAPLTKQLKELLDNVGVDKLEALVRRLEPEKFQNLLDDLTSSQILRESFASNPVLVDAWRKLLHSDIPDVVRKNSTYLGAVSKQLSNYGDKVPFKFERVLPHINPNARDSFFEALSNPKSIDHVRSLVGDFENIPGLKLSPFIKNSLPKVDILAPNTWADPLLGLPGYTAETFVNATAKTLSSGQKIYRVLSEGQRRSGGFWTYELPTKRSDLFGGTAVRPEWNGGTHYIEFTVPEGGLKIWDGPTARQPILEDISEVHLPGGTTQIFIPDPYRQIGNSYDNLPLNKIDLQ